jgi:hypothetical protein
MIWLPLLIIYTYFAQKTSAKYGKVWLTALLCVVPFVGLVGVRTLAYMHIQGFVYPVGITMPVLFSISYMWDCREDGAKRDMFSLASYICFFPLKILGPIVCYNDFCRITDNENIDFSLYSVADGVRLYAIGFVKRIAVGAVLVEGYQRIFTYSWDSPSLVTLMLLLVLIFFGVFFAVSGYYDMGVGIARMFGFKIAEVNVNPFTVATVNEYSAGLFGSLRVWVKKYVLMPFRKDGGKPLPNTVKMVAYCIFTVVIIRSDLSALLLCIPLSLFSLASAKLGLAKERGRKNRTGLRLLFGFLTMLVMATLWVFFTIGNGGIFEDVGSSLGNAEYQTDMMLISFSWIKYLLVILLGACTVVPRTDTAIKISAGLSPRLRAVRDYGSMVIMLVIFIFTAMFFLPQFEIYNTVPFHYIVM